MSSGSRHVRLRLPAKLAAELAARARAEGIGVDALVRRAVQADLDQARVRLAGARKHKLWR